MRLQYPARQPGRLLSINDVAGRSWASVATTKNHWLEGGWASGTNIRADLRQRRIITPLQVPCVIQFNYSVPVERRRDGHNYASTVGKWFIDGMVLARLFVDDDTTHLTVNDATFTVVEKPKSAQRDMTVTLEFADAT